MFIKSLIQAVGHQARSKVSSNYIVTRTMSSQVNYDFETLNVSSPSEFVKHVELNRPAKLNAMNATFWTEMIECFKKLSVDPDCRVVVLSGAGRMFTAGLDFKDSDALQIPLSEDDIGRKAFSLIHHVRELQASFTGLETCNKPVIAAIHNGCIGGGIDMVSAACIRYCTQDAWFQIKEVDLGLAADVGTLQRFPKIIGNDSLCRELVYTGRKFLAEEAKEIGFISRIFLDKESMIQGSIEMAQTIAEKSPVAVQGSKHNLVYSRDHTVQEGLDYMVVWNSAMLQSEDCKNAIMAMMSKQKPIFSKL